MRLSCVPVSCVGLGESVTLLCSGVEFEARSGDVAPSGGLFTESVVSEPV